MFQLLDKLMTSTIVRKVKRQFDKLWVRITCIGVLSLVAIAVARLTDPMMPSGIKDIVGAGSIGQLLQIIANSMLAVTTFSLTVMVSVYRSASSQWTPRAHRLMMDDATTKNTLSTLVGAYIYALASIILLETKIFADDQVVVLFFFTIFILVLIIVAIIRWIVHLQTLGSLIETTRRIEDKALSAFNMRKNKPCLGANPLRDEEDIPAGYQEYRAGKTGYIQYLYEEQLSEIAEKHETDIYLVAPVGRFVYRGDVIAWVRQVTDTLVKGMIDSIAIGDLRTFEQDPRFGLVVLGEIGSRAMSPGINDPGTAIDVLGRMTRLFDNYPNEKNVDRDEVPHPRLYLAPLKPADLIEDGFDAIARDGGAFIEVQLALQAALAHLSENEDADLAEAAQDAAKRAFERSEQVMKYGNDLERLRNVTPVEVQRSS